MNNDVLAKKLQNSGLSDKASLIYTCLLEMGGAYPSTLSRITKLNRSTVYKILLDLSVKGLITEIERGKKLFYQIEKPEKLIRYSRMQSEIAAEAYKNTRELLPEIEEIFGKNPNRPKIRYFQNADDIISIYEEMVSGRKKYEMIAFSNAEEIKRFFPLKALRKFVKAKERIGITTRAIVTDTEENRRYNSSVFPGIKKSIWPSIRYASTDIFPFRGEITMYEDNKVAIIKLKDNKLIGLIIEDQSIHDMMKAIFEMLWRSDQIQH